MKALILFCLLAGVCNAAEQFRRRIHNPSVTATEVYITADCGDCGEGESENQTLYYGPYILPPATTFVTPYIDLSSFDVGVGFSLAVTWVTVAETPQGASYLATGEPALDYTGLGTFTVGIADDDSAVVTLPVIRSLTPDSGKSLWLLTDSTLTADLFREGVDKIVAFNAVSMGGATGAAGEVRITNGDGQETAHVGPLETFKTAAEDKFIEMQTAMTLPTSRPTVGAISGGSGTILFMDLSSVGGGNYSLGVMGISGFGSTDEAVNDVIDWCAGIIHEVLLWGALMVFVYVIRKELYEWVKTGYMAPQLTTKTEVAQVTLPGVGLTKQAAIALMYFSAFVVAIGLAIGVANTEINVIASGQTLKSLTESGGGFSSWWGALTEGSAVATASVQLFLRFVPLAGLVQLYLSELFITAIMGPIFGLMLSITKAVHV